MCQIVKTVIRYFGNMIHSMNPVKLEAVLEGLLIVQEEPGSLCGSTIVHSQSKQGLGKDYTHPFIYIHVYAHVYVYLITFPPKHIIYDDIFCVSVEAGMAENMCVHVVHWQSHVVATCPDSKGEVRWLHWVFVVHSGSSGIIAICRVFSCSVGALSCSMWDLVPWPEVKPRPLQWERTTREVPSDFDKLNLWQS